MTADIALTLLTVLLGSCLIATVAAIADRHSRAAAWRQIALERRWNKEHQQRDPDHEPHSRYDE